MKIKILAINMYIESWQAVLEGELDGKTIFELTQEEYGHFVQIQNSIKSSQRSSFSMRSTKERVQRRNR